ncbi:MAG: RsmD family RNA methyltransferase [Paludibacteraceae bacterium]|nr:RsmD family RNA methyltransferase [Bacteroidales bacterium]MCQ2330532.1 RsmD family RNA methyltransferase [Paludibacteraceae bacterium]
MRIISGKYGGRRLAPPKNITARPTTDFAKESLFNLLNNRLDFEGLDMLDLFAGTGGIGMEFISRGARSVTSVELAHTQQNFIISACKQLGITNLSLVRSDVFKFINACRVQYDFIYADPPYALDKLPLLPDLVLPLLKADGLFVLEHGKDNDFSTHPNFIEMRVYGSVHFSFFHP